MCDEIHFNYFEKEYYTYIVGVIGIKLRSHSLSFFPESINRISFLNTLLPIKYIINGGKKNKYGK